MGHLGEDLYGLLAQRTVLKYWKTRWSVEM